MKPRPARTRRLYLIVGHRTIGLNLSTGRGATTAALERRALRRLSFRPGYSSWSDSPVHTVFPLCDLPGRSELGLVVANPFGNLEAISIEYIAKQIEQHTVVGDLLVMLDRHFVVMRSRSR